MTWLTACLRLPFASSLPACRGHSPRLALGSSPTFGYRYPAFANAISREFPHLQIISSSPYNYSGIFPGIDQHDYNTPAYFVGEYHRMDEWPRNGTKIYELEVSLPF